MEDLTYAITDDGCLLTLYDGGLFMSDEVKAQGPILGGIGGAWTAFEFAKKYGPWAMALIAWLVLAIPYMIGNSDKAPGLPPVLPKGLYVSDGVAPLHTATPEEIGVLTAK